VKQATVAWFKLFMHVKSGAETETYTLVHNKEEVYIQYRKDYPEIVRKIFDVLPSPDEEAPDEKLTRLQMNFARISSGKPFTIPTWFKLLEARKKKKKQRLTRAHGNAVPVVTVTCVDNGIPGIGLSAPTKVDTETSDSDSESDSSTEGDTLVNPLSYNVFWSLIKDSKVKFNRVQTPYRCEIHEKAPGWRRRKAEVEDQLTAINAPRLGSPELAALQKEIDDLTKKVRAADRHERQFEN
jgi:hypothetical protein